jgi:hypothetical protein
MISEEAKVISSQCRHYAMCKIDFLNTGVCSAGKEYHYVSYYPQGRMDIYHALANKLIPVTERLIDIAKTCTLCGICDKQCYFVTELRPMKVMTALKEYVDHYLTDNRKIEEIKGDAILRELKAVVGAQWATNDPAILVSYSNDPCPLTPMQMPRYVVMPKTKAEVAGIVTACNRLNIPYAVRGNGSSVIGVVMSEGVVIDMGRMKGIEIDRDNWKVIIEPGVSAYDLQRQVSKYGLRVNAAEPSAFICANIMSTGVFSLFSNAYGIAADNYINAEFVSNKGEVFNLNEKTAPNLYSFQNEETPSPGICVQASIRLHQTTDDEEGILIPFSDFDEAVSFARELSMRRIGIGIGILGGEYISTFMSPSSQLAGKLKAVFEDKLGIRHLVLVIGDKYAVEAIKGMTDTVIDNRLIRMLMLSLPKLLQDDWMDLVSDFEGEQIPYRVLCKKEMSPLLEAILTPAPELLAEAVDEDMRDFFEALYSRPEMTNLVWLNMFRIVSSRMGRYKHVIALIMYVRLDTNDIVKAMNSEFERIANKFNIKNDFGFLTPIDCGKRAVLEYDYYIDHTDRAEIKRVQKAMAEVEQMIEALGRSNKGIKWLKYIWYQGFARKESFLYT